MPEGPEIKRATDWLQRFVGGIITKIIIFGEINSNQFLTIIKVESHGKLLWLTCTQENSDISLIIIKLNLTGQLLVQNTVHIKCEAPDYCCAELIFKKPLPSLHFTDRSRFGWIKINKSSKELQTMLETLGPDPLKTPITVNDLIILSHDNIAKSSVSIAARLLDQAFIAGIGNFYRSEIIYETGFTKKEWQASSLSAGNIIKLMTAINIILIRGYEQGPHYVPKCYAVKGMKYSIEGGRRFYHA